MRDGLEEIVELSLLYDFYGELLKEHHKEIFEAYVLDDYSLSEIAEEEGITRQGVHDIVKRCIKQLKGYEEQLHLIEKFDRTRDRVIAIRNLMQEVVTDGETKAAQEAIRLADEILEEL